MTNFVNVWMFQDPMKLSHTITCAPFQIYLYENLFLPDKDSKLDNYKKLTNVTLEMLLNKLFSFDRENNEQIIKEYIKQRQIQMT